MSDFRSNVTVVIPTRNRLESLKRTLVSLKNQSQLPKEIIVVDSSDDKIKEEDINNSYTFSQLSLIHSKPSVCLQRNIGIEKSNSEYIFLCDDDMELPENYIESISEYLNENQDVNIVSGLVVEKRNEGWKYSETRISFLKLLVYHIFGLSVWAELKLKDFSKNKLIQNFVKNYLKKGNRIAKSGWPIVINYELPVFKTPIYSLMCAIVRSETIKKSPYDVAFYENGIGDNYDVLMSMNSEITVLSTIKVKHHKAPINRLKTEQAYYYRVSALHYILLKFERFDTRNLAFFMWSIMGNSMLFLSKGRFKMLGYNIKLLTRILANKSIYN
ncbi:glycosyl transferase family 2 [Tenacibaculum skagerrakense]|uniref:Glycosyl transferase family 2 n=1 Tax=Tenacibaculum skagerrakense TaxID=186571 RepID=A0A4R2P161_9FLAO|nr:glycosyltransferase family A protein [Tenacibaculum skagerrakense]TCP28282.1 glycosyl transferase family 2 [Tenacibaculum skagerrakense]